MIITNLHYALVGYLLAHGIIVMYLHYGIAICYYLKSLASVLMSHKVCQLCTHVHLHAIRFCVRHVFVLLLLFFLISALLSRDWMEKGQLYIHILVVLLDKNI